VFTRELTSIQEGENDLSRKQVLHKKKESCWNCKIHMVSQNMFIKISSVCTVSKGINETNIFMFKHMVRKEGKWKWRR
jgi:hypothetical protein